MSLSAPTYRAERNARFELRSMLSALTAMMGASFPRGLSAIECRVLEHGVAMCEILHGKLHLTNADADMTRSLHALKARVGA